MPGDLYFSLDIDGTRELSRRLHGLLNRVTNLEPAFKVMAADWSTTMAAKFDSGGAFEAGTDAEGNPNPPWQPLSQRYGAWKARHYPGRGLLIRTGALRAAAVSPETDIQALSLRLEVDNAWALYHQSTRPRTILPRRPFASLTAKQKGRWIKAIRDHIQVGG